MEHFLDRAGPLFEQAENLFLRRGERQRSGVARRDQDRHLPGGDSEPLEPEGQVVEGGSGAGPMPTEPGDGGDPSGADGEPVPFIQDQAVAAQADGAEI